MQLQATEHYRSHKGAEDLSIHSKALRRKLGIKTRNTLWGGQGKALVMRRWICNLGTLQETMHFCRKLD